MQVSYYLQGKKVLIMKSYIRIVIIISFPFLLNGCFIAAVGAGAGYIATKEENKNQKTIAEAKKKGALEQAAKDKETKYK